jgi:hypothetical protein
LLPLLLPLLFLVPPSAMSFEQLLLPKGFPLMLRCR